MKLCRKTLVAFIAASGYVWVGSLFAEEPTKPSSPVPSVAVKQTTSSAHPASDTKQSSQRRKPVVSDVALDKKGVLHGVVVDAQGVPAAGAMVRVMNAKRVIVQVKTDKMGRFAVRGLRAGVYRVVAAEGSCVCRVWAPAAAPPAASDGVLVVSRNGLLRAQYSPAQIFASDRFLLGATLAGGVAVPVAIYGNKGSGS